MHITVNNLNGRCTIMQQTMYEHVSNDKTQQSSRRHKSKCTVYQMLYRKMHYKRDIYF